MIPSSGNSVAVIDYGAGNVGSVLNMLKKVSVPAVRAQTAEDVAAAQRLILPGVGAFDYCMENFERSPLFAAVKDAAAMQKPLLGICVGFQMLFTRSEEGKRPGLGWIEGEVVRFDASRMNARQKIPHMGWSDVIAEKPAPLFAGMKTPRFYFVHSFHPVPKNPADSIATAEYGYRFCCGVRKGNIMGVQFHPEKSHRFGMQLFRNFSMAQAV